MTIIHKSIRIIDYEAQQVTPRETPETFDTYVGICANQTDENYVSEKMNIMAYRLLLKETEAQRQIHRTKTTVQKGSLIQTLLFDETVEKY